MRYIGIILLFAVLILTLSTGVLADNPENVFGSTIFEGGTSRLGPYNPDNHSAYAGNTTELTISGYSVTQSWQGYFGNVTGTITLSDSDSHVMYDWNVTSPRGQIYSSTNGTGIEWNYLQCFNYTAAGTFADDKAQNGSTSLYGLNLTQLHGMFTINSTGFDGSIRSSRDVDSVDWTFTFYGDGTGVDGKGHRQFYANYLDFTEGQCWTTRVYGSDGSQNEKEFEEVLLYEPESRSVIFASLLNEDLDGFDDKQHDFQMLVLEDGHGTDVATTTYYFYVEIE